MAYNNDAVRAAIDVMTAWTSEQDRTNFASSRVAYYVGKGPESEGQLLVGLLSLTGWLLTRLAKAEGESGNATPEEMRAILQDIALHTL